MFRVGSARSETVKLERLTQRETDRTSPLCTRCLADASADSDLGGEFSVNAALDRVIASRLVKEYKGSIKLF